MEDKIKTPKDYVSVSTRLSTADATLLQLICNRKKTTPSRYIREILKKQLKNPKKDFLAGKSRINYNKEKDNFSWFIELDNGKISKVLDNLSKEFIEDLQVNLLKGLGERAEDIDKRKKESVGVPDKLLEDENEK